jgi:hypothetical protein
MSGTAESANATPLTCAESMVGEREKWLAESAFRERELALKEREHARLDAELQLKRDEARRSRWSSPLVIAILGAVAAAVGNAAVSWQNGRAQRELEDARAKVTQSTQETNNKNQLDIESFKAESARLFEVVKTSDPDKAADNLKFLVDVGLISNDKVKIGLISYLQHRKEGQGFALPAAVPVPKVDLSAFDDLRVEKPKITLAKLTQEQRPIAQLIMDKFAAAGFSTAQQLAAVAVAIIESNLNPDFVGAGGLERGLYADREAMFASFGFDRSKDKITADLSIEVTIKAANVSTVLKESVTVFDAIVIFVRRIQRPFNPDADIYHALLAARSLIDK